MNYKINDNFSFMGRALTDFYIDRRQERIAVGGVNESSYSEYTRQLQETNLDGYLNFNKEINSIEDFKGLKMRMAGVGARVLNEFGASAQYLPASEIYLALERGRIDATEFSLPIIDKDFGFNQIAKFQYYPGWHQPGSVDVLMINMDVWNGLNAGEQAMYEAACQVSLAWTLQYAPAAQTPQIEEFEAGGTIVKSFPDEVLAELRVATERVLNAEAEKDALYGEAYHSMKAFVASSGRWSDLQTLPAE